MANMNDVLQNIRTNRKNNPAKVSWKGYVDCPIKEGDKETIEANANELTVDTMMTWIFQNVMDGYSFKVMPMDGQTTINVQLMDVDPTRGTAGFVLSAFHPDFPTALATLMYKHDVLFAEGWEVRERQRPLWG